MEKLTRLWPTAWRLVYSADDKCRAEHLERLRRTAPTSNFGRRMSDTQPPLGSPLVHVLSC
eukprot:361717-Amphidinium_carterae.1